MISKIWKKILFIILVIACLFNITIKLVQRNSFKQEIQASLDYIQSIIKDDSENKVENDL